jgi:hypothetical protein
VDDPVLVTFLVPRQLRADFKEYAEAKGKPVAEILRGAMEKAVEK